MKCTNCNENELEYAPLPHEYTVGKSVSLFGYRLLIYRDKPDPIDNMCGNCLLDRTQANEAERFHAAAAHGYDRGYEDGLANR